MRTIVLRNDDERTPGDSSAGEERRVTLFFPVTGDEYKQTRAAVEGVTPVGEEGSGPAGTPAGGRYVVTTDQQRREWGLADLANGPVREAAAPGDPDAMERSGAVSVVDSADALDLLFEDGASRSGAAALVDGAGGDVAAALVDGAGGAAAAAAAGGRQCGRTRPGAFVNLKHGRGRVPDHVLAVFGKLCRPGRIDSLLKSLDGLIKPLERMLAPGLEAAVREVEAVRGQEVTADGNVSRWFGQLEGLVKVYSDCEITPSSSSAPALTGGCHGWHEAGSYPVIDDDDALWNCGNLAAGAQAWAAALAREISNGLWAPASPPSGFSATVSGRPQAGQVHIAGWDMVLGPLMR